MRIEILHSRDSDGGCYHDVFVDGVRHDDVVVEDIDPGRGYMRSDWDEHTEYVAQAGYSEAFTDAVVANRNESRENKYIEDDRVYIPKETDQ